MAAAYISKYNIDHFIIWNSNIGGKFGNYVHFPASEMDEMLENRTIRLLKSFCIGIVITFVGIIFGIILMSL